MARLATLEPPDLALFEERAEDIAALLASLDVDDIDMPRSLGEP